MKTKGRKTSIQSASILARKYRSMANVVYGRIAQIKNPTEEQKATLRGLEEQAERYERRVMILPRKADTFTMIL